MIKFWTFMPKMKSIILIIHRTHSRKCQVRGILIISVHQIPNDMLLIVSYSSFFKKKSLQISTFEESGPHLLLKII